MPDQQVTAAAQAVRVILLLGFALVLVAGLPPHLSVDSVMALYEGRLQVRETIGPVVYAKIVGMTDAAPGGLGLYVVLSAACLFGSLAWMIRLRPSASWWAMVAAAMFVLSPTVVLYQGVVWKDVLFANLTIAGFVALAHGLIAPRGVRVWGCLLVAAAALAVAMSIRQNGAIYVVGAAVAVAWVQGCRFGRPRGAGLGLGWVVGVFLLAVLLGQAAEPRQAGPGRLGLGLRVLQHYDVVAILARQPDAEATAISRAGREGPAAVIKQAAVEVYSPERVDFFDRHPDLAPALWKTPASVMHRQWLELVSQYPATYLAHRWEAFRWLGSPPDLNRCVPVFVGVTGPPAVLNALGLEPRTTAKDRKLAAYAQKFVATPAFSHLFSGCAALLVLIALLWRGEAQDIVIAALLGSSLVFAASFFFISIACDHRYLYALDLAAATGALYLGLQPSVRRNLRVSPQRDGPDSLYETPFHRRGHGRGPSGAQRL